MVHYTILAVAAATAAAKTTGEAAAATTAEAAWTYGAAIELLRLYSFSPHIPLRLYGTHILYTTIAFYGAESDMRG